MKSRSTSIAEGPLGTKAWLGLIAGFVFASSVFAQQTPTLTEPPAERVRADVAEHGITAPTPEAIKSFLKDQGAWYTPFSRPGMTGPYDIRGWHSQPPRPKTEGGQR